jgi:hypothetical protein
MAYSDIKDPSAYFQTKTYTGTNNSNALTNDGNSDLKPDFLWIKRRDYNNGHQLLDSTRGVDKILGSELTSVETTLANRLSSFDTDGFTVESSSGAFNADGEPFVAWQWKANGGTTASNSDGSITSTVQANTTAGFSIVGYTCPNPITNFTIGHGLGVTPDVIIVKTRDGSRNWGVYHKSLTAPAENRNLKLNLTNAEAAESTFWANIAPTSSVITIAQNASVNYQGHNYIAYCFAEKQGYSKFGKYVGNGSSNGTFVYTGFAPAWIMLKDTSQATNWEMFDVRRNTFNVRNLKLGANLAVAENGSDLGTTSQNNIDILSNGFKMRTGNTDTNVSGDTYIYMAFASSPFTTSTGIPTTAR